MAAASLSDMSPPSLSVTNAALFISDIEAKKSAISSGGIRIFSE
jgi:hypothetical protein